MREQARKWLLQRLELLEEDPDVLADLPPGNVLESLREGDADLGEEADSRAAVDRIRARFSDRFTESSDSRLAAPTAPRPTPEREDRPPQHRALRRHRTRRVILAAAVVLVGFGLAWVAGPGSLSSTEQLVVLDEYGARISQAFDQPSAKATGPVWAKLQTGWAALRQAERRTLGLRVGYDEAAARQSLLHLEAAYRAGKSAAFERMDKSPTDVDSQDEGSRSGDPQTATAQPPQNLIALLIAQAYLMLEDTERARFWLQTASGFDDEPWRSAALALLEHLPPSDF